ncbi:MAG: hypothetical protein ACE5H4_08260 [Candidatus Thorarchaeota archaeon]
MTDCYFDSVKVMVRLGPYTDSKLDLVVKSKNVLARIDAGSIPGGLGISIQEHSTAENAEFWPPLTMETPDRRSAIHDTVKNALRAADRVEAKRIGIYTLGLEVARIPSWEVAEEVSKAVYDYSKSTTSELEIVVVTSSPTQMSSFQYALENVTVISS